MAAQFCRAQAGAAHRGGTRFLMCLGLLILLQAPILAGAVEIDKLERIRALTRGGATQLALLLMDQNQPAPVQTESWMQWEKERYALYRAQADWATLAAHAARLPDGLPVEFVLWARTEGARAYLSANNPPAARAVLRALLWQEQGGPEARAEWRQLVIRSYLVENEINDALIALHQYKDDFQVSSPAWRQFEAAILIRAGKARDAYTLVGDIKTHEGRLLSLYAGLQANVLKPANVLRHAQQLAQTTENKPSLNLQAWILVATAAERAKNPLRRLYALERALTVARERAAPDDLLIAGADDLWQAYEKFAESAGNDARLLVGDDAAWLKIAASYKRDDALQSRAFYAFLLGHAGIETRELAQRRLADSLIEDGRYEVLRALFTTGSRFPDMQAVPDYVRYRLADQALGNYDIGFAAQALQGLENPPTGENPDDWALRRARVLIYAGDMHAAAKLLNGILAGKQELDDDYADRFIQVLFDVQTAAHHTQAIALLEKVFQLSTSQRLQRETLYWMADSRAALGDHRQAAELYLRSATYKHPTGGDMWGQTARFHAAEELGKAGLTRDARLVYQALLRHAEDAKQRAVIERNIQQLWLIEKHATPP